MKEFRPFWLFALAIPALALSAPLVVLSMVGFPHLTWLAVLALVPLGWFYLTWRTTGIKHDASRKELICRKGIASQFEERIPLSYPPRFRFSQCLLGRVLDFGDVELFSSGGRVTYHQIGDFRAFKDLLTSPGEPLPEKGLPFLVVMIIAFFVGPFALVGIAAIGLIWLVRAVRPLLTRFLAWLRKRVQPFSPTVAEVAKSTFSIQGLEVSAFQANYDGFLAFCVDFVLPFNGYRTLPQDYTQPDGKRTHYRTGIAPDMAKIYLWVLDQVRIVVSGTDGRSGWILRRQIQTIDDIKLRVSHEVFEDIAGRYLFLGQIEQPAVSEMRPEYTLGVIKGNNNGRSSKQTLTFPESLGWSGPRPAA